MYLVPSISYNFTSYLDPTYKLFGPFLFGMVVPSVLPTNPTPFSPHPPSYAFFLPNWGNFLPKYYPFFYRFHSLTLFSFQVNAIPN